MSKEQQNNFLLGLKAALLFGLIAGFLSACSSEKEKEDKITADDVFQKGGETYELSKGFLSQEKQAFIRQAEVRLDSMRHKIDRMKKSLANMDTAATGLKQQIQDLESRERLLEEKLEELKVPNVWESLKNGLDTALSELEKAQKKLSGQFE